MLRDGFVFYRSFYEALRDLPRDIQGEIYTAIMEYSLYGNETVNLKQIARSIFTLIKPQLDANISKYENGKKGGRPKQEETEEEPNDNQTETESIAKEKDKVKEKYKENDKEKKKLKEDSFYRFWELYDHKKEKPKCLQKWMILKDEEIENILSVVSDYVSSTPDKKFRKHPITWLNNRCWEDEITPKRNSDREYKPSIPESENVW